VPSGVVTPFSATFTLGATDATNGLMVEVFTSSTVTCTNKNFALSDWQLELGSVKTPYEMRPIGVELALCQRYYESLSYPSNSIITIGQALGVSNATFSVNFQKKRAIPTVTISGPLIYLTAAGSSAGNVSNANVISDINVRFSDTSLSGLVAGNATIIFPNGAAGIFNISAEL
jgi:hypothetical protein